MNPVETKIGRSFKGAVLYYTHDTKALTAERLLFTHTVNLSTDNTELAAKIMAYTAMHNNELRRQSGNWDENSRKSNPKSVYAYCLTWDPDQNPTREQMIEAAQETLQTLKLDGHEVIMAAHNDTKHPHIHIIANVIHPETGIRNKLQNSKTRLQAWAREYQKERGETYSPQREINHQKRQENRKRRAAGEKIYDRVKDRNSQPPAEYHRWRREQTLQRVKRRQQQVKNLSDHHKREQKQLIQARERTLADRRTLLREINRPEWAALYRRQERQRQDFAVQ